LPATTGLHVPTLPATLQASQEPPQPVLQHTPSTQLPLPHWLAAEQVAPFVRLGTQAPASQKLPLLQCASVAQAPGHEAEEPSHT
jgi:hypothetical protein